MEKFLIPWISSALRLIDNAPLVGGGRPFGRKEPRRQRKDLLRAGRDDVAHQRLDVDRLEVLAAGSPEPEAIDD